MHLRFAERLVSVRGRSEVADVDSVSGEVEKGMGSRSCRCRWGRSVAFLGKSLWKVPRADVKEGVADGVNGTQESKSTLTILNVLT